MTNQQLIEKIKEIIKDDNILKYYVREYDDDIIIIKDDLNNLKSLTCYVEKLVSISDMTEELDLRPYMRKFQITLSKTKEVWFYYSMRNRVYKDSSYTFRHTEVEIK